MTHVLTEFHNNLEPAGHGKCQLEHTDSDALLIRVAFTVTMRVSSNGASAVADAGLLYGVPPNAPC